MRVGVLGFLAVALLLSAGSSAGQDVTATVTGTVTDPSGSPIKWPLRSGKIERFTNLPVDRYIIVVEGDGKWK